MSHYQSQEIKKTWRQLMGKREDMISKIIVEEMEQHVHKLCIQIWTMLMTLSMETPNNACVSIGVSTL